MTDLKSDRKADTKNDKKTNTSNGFCQFTAIVDVPGNYNNDESDDFLGRDGRSYFDSEDFGRTWRVGPRSRCRRKKTGRLPDSPCTRSKSRRRRARQACRVLHQKAFAHCHDKVDVEPYYRWVCVCCFVLMR